MKTRILIFLFLVVLLLSCDNKKKIDEEKPIINLAKEGSFPVGCDTFEKGKNYNIVLFFEDNFELGSYSIEIHHNFDHHTHTTETIDCELGSKKKPVNPWKFIKSYDIPASKKEFLTKNSLKVPTDIDAGDYHFVIQLTDKEGWSTLKGLSVKVVD